jgi:hypothetical protein
MMSEMNPETSPEPQKSKGGIPQDVADDVAVLAGEIRAMESKAAGAWKIAAVVWIILLAVIAGYLSVIYGKLKDRLTPDVVIELGIGQVNSLLAGYGAPEIDSPMLPEWLAGELKAQAPIVLKERLKPMLEDLQQRLPELRQEFTERAKAEAPVLMDQAVDRLETDLLPRANDALMKLVEEQVEELIQQVEEGLDAAVAQVVADVKTSTDDLADAEKMQAAMAAAFEEAMGPILDEMFAQLDDKVAVVRSGMESLSQKRRAGALTHKERLEVRLIQLIRALFEGAAYEEAAEVETWADELTAALKEYGLDMDIQLDIRESVRAGMQPDLSRVPEEMREGVEKSVLRAQEARKAALSRVGGPPSEVKARAEEAAKRAAETAEKRREAAEEGEPSEPPAGPAPKAPPAAVEPGPPGGPPGGAAGPGGPPPEVKARVEEAKKKAAEAAAKKREAAKEEE